MKTAEPYRARRTAHNAYELRWPGGKSGKLKVSVTDSPQQVINSELIYETELDFSAKSAVITVPDTEGTVFFHLLTPSGEEHVITDRVVPAEGVRNFRDFGGYHTTDGRRVRWQALYRSGHLGSLTESDKQMIAALGINLVCDFRTQPEMDLNPTSLAEGHTPQIVQLRLNPGDNIELFGMLKDIKGTTAVRAAGRKKMLHINREIVQNKTESYRDMFQSILASEGPALIHCSAGKDRTGFGAAIILAALGVPEKTIFHDYLLTNEFLDIDYSMRWLSDFTGITLDKKAAEPIFEVHADYLRSAFDTIKAEHGDVDTFIRNKMELDEHALQALRQRYLEP
ncbi:MAG: tyrosine-protein phosphatase [Gammaproteobacteria bacterium]|nr:tyrosine-protein phosphatase [Gammaproteobacteria bacterium]